MPPTVMTLTLPPTVSGDILIVHVTGTHGVGTPTGWTALTSSSANGLTFSGFTKVADGTETSVIVTFGSVVQSFFALVYCEYPSGLSATPLKMITMGG